MASFAFADQKVEQFDSGSFSSVHRGKGLKSDASVNSVMEMPARKALRSILGIYLALSNFSCIYEDQGAKISSFGVGQSPTGLNRAPLYNNSPSGLPHDSAASVPNFQISKMDREFGGALNFLKRSKLSIGLQSGYNNAQASFLTNGFVAGGSVELIFNHFGIWGSLMTGQSGTKTHDLQTAQYSVALKGGGTVGVLTGTAGISYYYDLFPKVAVSLGAGIQYSTYNTSYVTVGPAYALAVVPGISYEISRSWGIGLQVPISSTSVTNISANNTRYDLTAKEQALMTQFLFVFKYRLN